MSQANITVAGITPPAAGKKQGDIIDTQGNKWKVWGDKLHLYQMGGSYSITYETNEFKGQQFNVIKTVNPAAPQQQPRVQQPAPVQAAQQGQQFTSKDEMIFVCGVINNAMGNSNINPFEITITEFISMVNKSRQAWRNTFGKSQSGGDMDDEIPF